MGGLFPKTPSLSIVPESDIPRSHPVIPPEILAADTQCHVQCYDTVSDLLYDSKYKSSKEHSQLFTQFSVQQHLLWGLPSQGENPL